MWILFVWHLRVCAWCFIVDCPSRTFGPGCSSVCHCLENIACDADTGTCSVGCAEGWTGEACSIEQGKSIKCMTLTEQGKHIKRTAAILITR